MELFVWPSDFGLPSVDANCLQFMMYSRLCAAPVQLRKSGKPWTAPNGQFPVFQNGMELVLSEFDEFVSYLSGQMPDLAVDSHVSEELRGELLSFQALVRQKLFPAHQYFLWLDNANFNTVTNRWFGKNIPFPYNLYYTARRRRHANEYLRELYPGALVSDQDIEFATRREAITCVNLLSSKLGDNKYLYGDKPTSVDATVFAYLAPLLKLPLPNDRIQQHIKGCLNLVRYVESMISIYLPLSEEELARQGRCMDEWERRKAVAQSELRAARESQAKSEEETEEFPMKNKILFGVGAVVLSLLAAVHFGLIRVEVREVEVADAPPRLPEGPDFAAALQD